MRKKNRCKDPDQPADVHLPAHNELALRVRELRLFKSIVESSGEAIAVSDPDGRLIYINPAHEKLFGRTLAEARHLNYRDYYPPESVAVLENEVVPALARGESWEGELDAWDADGRRFPLWERADTVRDENGNMLFGFGLMHDVSERRKAEALLRQRTDALGERVKELNCLFAISRLVDRPGATLNDIVQGILQLIPSAWQYADITCARIVIKDQVYQTNNFRHTIWKLTGPITVRDKDVGTLTVGYLEQRPQSFEGPFLNEERLLINAIAERLGKMIERFQAELALRESEERYRLLYEQASDGIFLFDDQEVIFDANPQILEVLGYRLEEVIGINVLDLIHPDDLRRLPSQINRLLAGEIVRVERRLRCKNGQYVTFEQSVRRIMPNTILSLYRDISERKQAEEKIRMLSHQLLSAQEEERRMLSRELHDRLAQDLSASKITCDMVNRAICRQNKQQAAALGHVSKTLEKTIQAVRDLSYEMRPVELSELGLTETIDTYCREFAARNNLDVHFQSAGLEAQPVEANMAINLFRLIQEGLNNIVKHAAAGRAGIRLVRAFPNIVLRIEDDGIGFDVEKRMRDIVREKRMGLSSMQERVNLLGGRMRIRSEPGKGTRLSIKIPLA